jgi:predicted outer membrane protein
METGGEELRTLAKETAMPVKLTVTLSEEVVTALRELATANGISVTEQLRRAISTEKWLHDVRARNARVLVEDPDRGTREVEFIR